MDQPLEHRDITFGDTVRVKATPETEAAAVAGLTGEVCGRVYASISGASPIIGPLTEDYAVNVFFPDRNEGPLVRRAAVDSSITRQARNCASTASRVSGCVSRWKWELTSESARPCAKARPGLLRSWLLVSHH